MVSMIAEIATPRIKSDQYPQKQGLAFAVQGDAAIRKISNLHNHTRRS